MPIPIDYFNKNHPFMGIQVKLSLHMRLKMLKAMPLRAGMTILEVGVTPEMKFTDLNYFSKQALAMGCEVWVTSKEDCQEMAKRFGFKWVSMADLENYRDRYPAFDFVLSAAVLEHVGEKYEEKAAHLRFLDFCAGKYIVITTPNRSHWLEVHTKLPLIHWLPKPAHRAILKTFRLTTWSDPSHLDLLNPKEFRQLMQSIFSTDDIEFKHFYFLGAASNLMAIVTKKTPSRKLPEPQPLTR